MLMQALKTFRRSDTGEIVRAGHEFDVGQGLARAYEKQGMARNIAPPAVAPRKVPENKAAQTGPLASAGGGTGADKPQPSSPAVQAPVTHRSIGLPLDAGSSPSTVHGNSSPAQTSSTPVTAHGGKGKAGSRRSAD